MERRVLLAVVLSMAVLYAYQAFLAPPPLDPAKVTQQQGQQKSGSAPAPPAAAGKAVAAAPTVPAPQTMVGESTEREIVVETADVEAVLTNRGGRVIHWRLKKYVDDEGKPVDLVPSQLPASQPTPFALKFDDEQLTSRINDALFQVAAEGRVDATASAKTVSFDYQD